MEAARFESELHDRPIPLVIVIHDPFDIDDALPIVRGSGRPMFVAESAGNGIANGPIRTLLECPPTDKGDRIGRQTGRGEEQTAHHRPYETSYHIVSPSPASSAGISAPARPGERCVHHPGQRDGGRSGASGPCCLDDIRWGASCLSGGLATRCREYC